MRGQLIYGAANFELERVNEGKLLARWSYYYYYYWCCLLLLNYHRTALYPYPYFSPLGLIKCLTDRLWSMPACSSIFQINLLFSLTEVEAYSKRTVMIYIHMEKSDLISHPTISIFTPSWIGPSWKHKNQESIWLKNLNW